MAAPAISPDQVAHEHQARTVFIGMWQVLWVLKGSIVALCKSGDPPRTSSDLQLVPAYKGIQWQCIGNVSGSGLCGP